MQCAAWALNPRVWTSPLVVLAACRMVFIYDPTTSHILGALKGHGGVSSTFQQCQLCLVSNRRQYGQEITSIAVHHIHPYMFLTTSRDQTTRLWDLRFRPRQQPNNPPWPPAQCPSQAGVAFGLHMNESEGDREGWGRCLAVLVGGKSGGHQAAVLYAVIPHLCGDHHFILRM